MMFEFSRGNLGRGARVFINILGQIVSKPNGIERTSKFNTRVEYEI